VLNQPAPVNEFDFDSGPTAAQLDIAEGNFSPQEVKKPSVVYKTINQLDWMA